MAQTSRTVAIIGGGVVAHAAAEGLRQAGFDGRVVIVGAEPNRPYDRPPCSKEFLRGEKPREELFYWSEAEYSKQNVELLLSTRALALRPRERAVELSSGERLTYDQLLIATGSTPRRLRLPGGDLPGVHYLRTMDDSAALHDALRQGKRLVVVGGGFIGCEVAASARALGLDVTLLEHDPVPLRRAMGEEVGAIYAAVHRDHGVMVATQTGVAEFRGHGRVEEVVTAAGAAIACDVVVVGVGIHPEVSWLENSGVAISNGVEVDDHCRTSIPDVFAAGDVAFWPYGPEEQRIRIEHWDHAHNHGAYVAGSLVGKPEPYAPMPYFWSDQYDLSLEYAGFASRWDRVVLRGDVPRRSFSAFYIRDRRVRAALTVNRADDLDPGRQLIESGAEVDQVVLADSATDLKELASRPTNSSS